MKSSKMSVLCRGGRGSHLPTVFERLIIKVTDIALSKV